MGVKAGLKPYYSTGHFTFQQHINFTYFLSAVPQMSGSPIIILLEKPVVYGFHISQILQKGKAGQKLPNKGIKIISNTITSINKNTERQHTILPFETTMTFSSLMKKMLMFHIDKHEISLDTFILKVFGEILRLNSFNLYLSSLSIDHIEIHMEKEGS